MGYSSQKCRKTEVIPPDRCRSVTCCLLLGRNYPCLGKRRCCQSGREQPHSSISALRHLQSRAESTGRSATTNCEERRLPRRAASAAGESDLLSRLTTAAFRFAFRRQVNRTHVVLQDYFNIDVERLGVLLCGLLVLFFWPTRVCLQNDSGGPLCCGSPRLRIWHFMRRCESRADFGRAKRSRCSRRALPPSGLGLRGGSKDRGGNSFGRHIEFLGRRS
jgi:hypothetical protein